MAALDGPHSGIPWAIASVRPRHRIDCGLKPERILGISRVRRAANNSSNALVRFSCGGVL
ncbi:predicted protein [Uncinocarpus reesii 1704]|uniref:Uncharacterized protein n=1 Tax=Uncinocarpus reesii (strain UAMH 1704) TaxID=336963 RepID=C4JE69_UNCRE|nr:uncharacterized protein UREG_00493 [Uncinocarpus reesii 1704]EEP75647.1 predicted protein [Uncinocarpus reesii 1704]